jgi:hypothetical protein
VYPGKVRDVLDGKLPRTVHQLHSFLGLAGYYRRFIPNFSKIAKPITDLLKKDMPRSRLFMVTLTGQPC